MCGIFGASFPPMQCNEIRDNVRRLGQHLERRGPDALGITEGWEQGYIFGHRRLSIIDTSDRSDQPFVDQQNGNSITFNGEIYNYRSLREELIERGHSFRTCGDTEVVLKAWSEYGSQMFGKLRGMYAFAIHEKATNSIIIARDPYGIKPLYIGYFGSVIYFSSSAQSIALNMPEKVTTNPVAKASFLMWGSVLEPVSMYNEIEPLPAGHFCLVREGRVLSQHVHTNLFEGLCNQRSLRRETLLEIVHDAVEASVVDHLEADVPIALFLSGGVDSAVIAQLVSRHAPGLQAVNLFFEALEGARSDERSASALIADTLSIELKTFSVSDDDILEEVPAFLGAMDQPTIDGINTWMISKRTAEAGFKVALSGTGGDEVFSGYGTFEVMRRIVMLGNLLSVLGLGPFARRVCDTFKLPRGKMEKLLAAVSVQGDAVRAYQVRRGLFMPSEIRQEFSHDVLLEAIRIASPEAELTMSAPSVVALESAVYLRNQLLRDADWASMHHSLEVRVPFADAHLFMCLREHLNQIHRFGGKALQLAGAAPEMVSIIPSRKKSGFEVPIAKVLRAVGIEQAEVASRGSVPRAWARYIANSKFPA